MDTNTQLKKVVDVNEWGDKTEYYVDSEGLKQGEYKISYKNGDTWVLKNYKDGKLHGKQETWWNGGDKTKCLSFYEDGKEISVDEWGNSIKYHIDFEGLPKQGEYKIFYNNGNMQFLRNFKDGKLHGKQEQWYEDGNLDCLSFYEHGKNIKSTIFFKRDGKKSSQFDYNHGTGKRSLERWWGDDGQLTRYSGYNEKGDYIGNDFWWNSNRQLIKHYYDTLIDGKRYGFRKKYDSNGQLIELETIGERKTHEKSLHNNIVSPL